MKLLAKIEKNKNFWALFLIIFSFFFLRFPSLFEPYWYGDEGIYQVLGMGINKGRLLYQGIWDNKPPLLYLIYAWFSSDQFMVRLFSILLGGLSVISFYFLAKELFKKEGKEASQKVILITTFVFSFFFSIPLLEGNIANSENFMLFPIILSSFLVLKSKKRTRSSITYNLSSTTYILLAGLLLSLAFLLKAVAVFDFIAILIFLFISDFPRRINIQKIFSPLKNLVPFTLSFFLPIFGVALFFFFKNSLSDFLSATFIQNVGYVGWGNKFMFAQGLLLLKLLILFSFMLFLLFKRKIFNHAQLFILIWFSFSLFNAFFSQRPYTHYLLVLLPSLVLLGGLIFSEKKYKKIGLILLAALLIILLNSFNIYGKTSRYYQNFYSFLLNKKSFSNYVAFFDRRTLRDYQIAEFIKLHTEKKDQIFIWGNSAQIYKMTNKLPPGRYTVAYHMTSSAKALSETESDLKKQNPKLIVVESSKNFIPFSLEGYTQKYIISGSIIYERDF